MLSYNVNILANIDWQNSQQFNYNCNDVNLHLYCNLIFRGINNPKLRDKIFTSLNLRYLINRDNHFSFYQTNNIVNKLRHSGFFDNIKVSFFDIVSKHNFVVHLQMKPVVKTITIQGLSLLKIPKSYLCILFKKQIGYPRNLQQIYSAIKKIRFWYMIRGYKWMNIAILNQDKNVSELVIKISEGKLEKARVLSALKNNLNQDVNKKLIIQELNLYTNEILNIKRIEAGIARLKERKIITNCHYKVLQCNFDQLEMVLTYSQFQDRETYISSEIKSISKTLHKLLNQNFYCSLKYNLNKKIQFFVNNISEYIYCNSFYKNDYIFLKYFNYTFISTKLISQFLLIKVSFDRLYISSRIFYSTYYFQLRHYISNLGNNCSTLFINIQLYSNYPQINIYFLLPLLRNIKYSSYYLTLHIFQDLHKLPESIISILNKKLVSRNLFLLRSSVAIQGLSFVIKQNILSNCWLLKTITKQNNLQSKYLIYRNKEWNYLKQLSLSVDNSYSYNLNTKKLLKKTIKLSLRAIYTNIDKKHNLIPGIKAFFESIFSKPSMHLQKRNKLCKKYINQINIKYTQVFNLPLTIRHIIYNNFIFQPEMNLHLNDNLYLIINEDTLYKQSSTSKIYEETFLIKFLKLYKLNLEYHIAVKWYASMFIFFRYSQKNYFYGLDNKYLEIDRKTSHTIMNYQKILLRSGLGLQINLPVRQIPPLRLEYISNKNKKKIFCVKLYSNKF